MLEIKFKTILESLNKNMSYKTAEECYKYQEELNLWRDRAGSIDDKRWFPFGWESYDKWKRSKNTQGRSFAEDATQSPQSKEVKGDKGLKTQFKKK